MKRLYDEKLLGNKLIALALVIIMHIVFEYALALVPIVWFFCMPTALVLTFTSDDMINLKGGK